MYINYSNLSEKSTVTDLSIMTCGYHKCDPGHFFGPAIRDYYLVHFIKSGEGTFKTSTGTFQIGRGGIFLINPSELTYYCASDSDPWEYYWVGFNGIHAKEFLSYIGFSYSNPVIYSSYPDKITDIISSINEIAISKKATDLGMIGLLYLFFHTLIEENSNSIDMRKENNRIYFEKSIAFFEQNYPYKISVTNLSKSLGLDRTNLFRIFVRESGISPQEYLVNFRIKKACELLTKTSLSIATIAESVGIQNSCHFSSIFKDRIGLAPREFRKSPTQIEISEHKI